MNPKKKIPGVNGIMVGQSLQSHVDEKENTRMDENNQDSYRTIDHWLKRDVIGSKQNTHVNTKSPNQGCWVCGVNFESNNVKSSSNFGIECPSCCRSICSLCIRTCETCCTAYCSFCTITK